MLTSEWANVELHSHPFLKGLSEDYCELIAGCSEIQSFQKGEFMLRNQQSAETFFLLLEGQVILLNHLTIGGVRPLETIAAPEVVGWSWLMPPYRWHFDVQVTEKVHCITVHTPCLLAKMEGDTAFAAQMYRRFMIVVINRLQASRLQGMDIYGNPGSGA